MTYRRCSKDWPVPGHEGIVIPEGMRVMLPIRSLHVSTLTKIARLSCDLQARTMQMDPTYHENPETFDPDRFSPERKGSMKGGSYMPFCMGPRQCMGMKIARLETKVLIYNMVRAFRIEPSDKTPVPLELSKAHFAKVSGGNWLKFIPRS